VRRTLLLIILDLATFGTTRFYETETARNPLPSLRPHCELKRWVCWRSAGWRLAVAFCSRELRRFWLLSPICLFSNICIHILLLEWAVVDAILHEFIEVGHLCLRYSYWNPEDSFWSSYQCRMQQFFLLTLNQSLYIYLLHHRSFVPNRQSLYFLSFKQIAGLLISPLTLMVNSFNFHSSGVINLLLLVMMPGILDCLSINTSYPLIHRYIISILVCTLFALTFNVCLPLFRFFF